MTNPQWPQRKEHSPWCHATCTCGANAHNACLEACERAREAERNACQSCGLIDGYHEKGCHFCPEGNPWKPELEAEQQYPCAKCGKLRTKAQGGTTFTVCDECWDKKPERRLEALDEDKVASTLWERYAKTHKMNDVSWERIKIDNPAIAWTFKMDAAAIVARFGKEKGITNM